MTKQNTAVDQERMTLLEAIKFLRSVVWAQLALLALALALLMDEGALQALKKIGS